MYSCVLYVYVWVYCEWHFSFLFYLFFFALWTCCRFIKSHEQKISRLFHAFTHLSHIAFIINSISLTQTDSRWSSRSLRCMLYTLATYYVLVVLSVYFLNGFASFDFPSYMRTNVENFMTNRWTILESKMFAVRDCDLSIKYQQIEHFKYVELGSIKSNHNLLYNSNDTLW